jgi:hypothetical protein
MENPDEIRRSWALQSNWMTGPKVVNKLQPPAFGRVTTPFVQTWRENAEPTLDWTTQNFSVYIPEGVRCISSAYLHISLPSAEYCAYPGLHIIDTFTLRSAGQIVYTYDYNQVLSDYCESLSDQKLRAFADIYLGGSAASVSGVPGARDVKLPLLLPNSTYMRRSDNSTAGHGVFGTMTGNQKIEMEVTMLSNLHPGRAAGANDPGSIAGACTIMYHTVDVPTSLRKKYEDLRGFFNIVMRRFTQLTPQWTHYPQAGVLVTDALSQPSGVVTEVMILAVPHQDEDADRQTHDYIKPVHFEVVHDMVTQKRLDTVSKIKTELFTNGFAPPNDFASPGRLCFASHCASDSTNLYSGGYDCSNASSLQFRFKFDQAVDYRLVAIQYANCKIDGAGILSSSLDGI